MKPDELLRENERRAQAAAERVGRARLRKILAKAAADLARSAREAEGLRGPGPESFTAVRARLLLRQVEAVLRDLKPELRDLALDRAREVAPARARETLEYIRAAERKFTGIAKPLGLDTAAIVDQASKGAEASVLRRLLSDPDHPARAGILDRYGEATVGNFERVLQQRALVGKPWAEVREELTAASPFLQGAPAHWSERILRTECLVGSTPVSGAVVRAVTRRWHEGDVIEIVTEGGRHFTATANHPMLTRRGWVPAGFLRESDDLICDRGAEDSRPSRREDVDDRQTSIGEVFDALSAVGVRERRRGTKPDFHGDGADREVDVATPFRPLVVGSFAAIFEPLAEYLFAPTDLARAAFCSLCGRLLSIDEKPCFCRSSHPRTGFLQAEPDQVVADPILFGECLRRNPLIVFASDLLGADVGPVGRCDASPLEELLSGGRAVAGDSSGTGNLRDEVRIDSQFSTHFVRAEPGAIEFDRVRSVQVRVFHGFVFNLWTSDGYFTINGAYTGNTMHANNVANLESIKAANDKLGGDMVKILSCAFDGRTGADSFAVHGQVRRVSEPFDTWYGPRMAPPDRPNDRGSVVPHRIGWPLPASLKPRSDAEVAARWREEGRKGSPPPRPRLSTVDLAAEARKLAAQ